jgi:vacuolar-type H+-ATPase subunit I/STV1
MPRQRYSSEYDDPPELELRADQTVDPQQIERLDTQVQRAQEQLLQLRRQQELIERQKRELEELSRKQEELDRGRSEMMDLLTRAVVTLERETYEAEKRVEQLRVARETFIRHLGELEGIEPAVWETEVLPKELNKSLGVLEAARVDYERMSTRINASSVEEVLDPHQQGAGIDDAQDFVVWLKRGFAFTLPLIVLGLIGLIVWFLKAPHP